MSICGGVSLPRVYIRPAHRVVRLSPAPSPVEESGSEAWSRSPRDVQDPPHQTTSTPARAVVPLAEDFLFDSQFMDSQESHGISDVSEISNQETGAEVHAHDGVANWIPAPTPYARPLQDFMLSPQLIGSGSQGLTDDISTPQVYLTPQWEIPPSALSAVAHGLSDGSSPQRGEPGPDASPASQSSPGIRCYSPIGSPVKGTDKKCGVAEACWVVAEDWDGVEGEVVDAVPVETTEALALNEYFFRQHRRVELSGLEKQPGLRAKLEYVAEACGDVTACWLRAREASGEMDTFRATVLFECAQDAKRFIDAADDGRLAKSLGPDVEAKAGRARYCPCVARGRRCRDTCCTYVHKLNAFAEEE